MKARVQEMNEDLKKAFPDMVECKYGNPHFDYCYYSSANPYAEIANQKTDEKHRLIDKKINDVLIEIELGVKNKKELEEIISKI